MRRPYLLATVSIAVVIAATPVQAGSPALIVGLVAVGVVGTALVVSARRSAGNAWAYTPEHGWVGGAREDVSAINAPLAPRASISQRIVSACRDAIASNAQRYDLASLEAVPAGPPTRVNGRTVAPLEVRAIYRVHGVNEVRRSTVRCEIDRAGRVLATS
jgi:hypothetical protein